MKLQNNIKNYWYINDIVFCCFNLSIKFESFILLAILKISIYFYNL